MAKRIIEAIIVKLDSGKFAKQSKFYTTENCSFNAWDVITSYIAVCYTIKWGDFRVRIKRKRLLKFQ